MSGTNIEIIKLIIVYNRKTLTGGDVSETGTLWTAKETSTYCIYLGTRLVADVGHVALRDDGQGLLRRPTREILCGTPLERPQPAPVPSGGDSTLLERFKYS